MDFSKRPVILLAILLVHFLKETPIVITLYLASKVKLGLIAISEMVLACCIFWFSKAAYLVGLLFVQVGHRKAVHPVSLEFSILEEEVFILI